MRQLSLAVAVLLGFFLFPLDPVRPAQAAGPKNGGRSAPASEPFESLRSDAAWCGPRILYFFACYLGREQPLDVIVALSKADEGGLTSLADLARTAGELGLEPTALRCTAEELATLGGPAVISVSNQNQPTGPVHFVGILRCENDRVVVVDPSVSMGAYRVTKDFLASVFTGHALLLNGVGASRVRWLNLPRGLGLALCWAAALVWSFGPVRWRDRRVAPPAEERSNR